MKKKELFAATIMTTTPRGMDASWQMELTTSSTPVTPSNREFSFHKSRDAAAGADAPAAAAAPAAHAGGEPFTVNLVVCVVAVMTFIVIQCAFFWKIASRELEHNVRRKSRIVGTVRRELGRQGLDDAVALLDAAMLGHGSSVRDAARHAEEERAQANLQLYKYWIGPILGVLLVILVGLLLWNAHKGYHLTFAHKAGIAMILLVYVPEVLIFRYVVEAYSMIGDYELAQRASGWEQLPEAAPAKTPDAAPPS